jgi:hypothetical protein
MFESVLASPDLCNVHMFCIYFDWSFLFPVIYLSRTALELMLHCVRVSCSFPRLQFHIIPHGQLYL